ncbi:MAG: peptidase MA family metallohydrolase [Candidatus Omnitrophota bacterium]
MKKIKLLLCFLLFFPVCFSFASDMREKKSTHFIIYYEGVPEDFVGTVIKYAEGYYTDLTEKLGFRRFDYWTWENRAKIYIYPDQETYTKETRQPAWSGGVVSYQEKSIWTFPRESGFFDSLLPHEIGHIVFREVVGSGRRSVPLWLDEGVASYLEEAKRVGANMFILKAMRNNTFIPFAELNRITPSMLRQRSDVDLFYAESVSIVSYLIEKFGATAFNDFCRKLRDGKSLDRALSFSYFYIRNSDDLGEFWERYLEDKLKGIK